MEINNLLDKIEHGKHQFGEQNAMSQFTLKQVKDIRVRLKSSERGRRRRLAEEFGVTVSTFSAINL